MGVVNQELYRMKLKYLPLRGLGVTSTSQVLETCEVFRVVLPDIIQPRRGHIFIETG